MQASVFGSTGSIGINALDVLERLHIPVIALAAGRQHDLLEQQARRYKPRAVALFDPHAANQLKIALADTNIRVYGGEEGVLEAAALSSDIWINAIVGIAGLRPTLTAMGSTRRVALANKETLVCGGKPVLDFAKRNHVELIPVDSEHSAIFQALQSSKRHHDIKRILLTCSGGPFFGKSAADLSLVRLEDALKHPNWTMGAKITIDSATLMNKGLEVIEAMHLFDLTADQIEVMIHRESVIHSMVEYVDGSIIGQLGVPDMRVPIQYAITYPNREPSPAESLDLFKIQKLTFHPPDTNTFPCLQYAIQSAKEGAGACVRLNAANEAAVERFLNREIRFIDIPRLIEQTMQQFPVPGSPTIEQIFEIDRDVRTFIAKSATHL